MGDSGESNEGSRFLGGSIPLANCASLGGDGAEGSSLGCRSIIDACTSDIRASNLPVSEGWRRCRPVVADGGLDRELALLPWLYPEASEDCDSLGV
jgi:hypothetical protein